MDKYGIEYKFNKEEDAIIEERPIDVAPFPDMPAEAPGIMTQYENLIDGEDVIKGKPVSNNEEQAMLAVEFGTRNWTRKQVVCRWGSNQTVR